MFRWIVPSTWALSFCAETRPEIRELVRRSLSGLDKEDQKLHDYG